MLSKYNVLLVYNIGDYNDRSTKEELCHVSCLILKKKSVGGCGILIKIHIIFNNFQNKVCIMFFFKHLINIMSLRTCFHHVHATGCKYNFVRIMHRQSNFV